MPKIVLKRATVVVTDTESVIFHRHNRPRNDNPKHNQHLVDNSTIHDNDNTVGFDITILSPDRRELAELMAEEMVMHSKKGLSWDRMEAKASQELKLRIQMKRLFSSFHGSAMNLLVGKGPVRAVFMQYRTFLYQNQKQQQQQRIKVWGDSADGSSSSSSEEEGETFSVHDDANTLLSLKVNGADHQRRLMDHARNRTHHHQKTPSKTRTISMVTPSNNTVATVQRHGSTLLNSSSPPTVQYQHIVRNYLDLTAARYDEFSQHLEELIMMMMTTDDAHHPTIPRNIEELLENFFLEEQDHVFQLQTDCRDVVGIGIGTGTRTGIGMMGTAQQRRRLDFFCVQMQQHTKAFLGQVQTLLKRSGSSTTWLEDHRDMWTLQFRCMETILGLHMEGVMMVEATK